MIKLLIQKATGKTYTPGDYDGLSLFARKFSFLGDNFKRINLVREVQAE